MEQLLSKATAAAACAGIAAHVAMVSSGGWMMAMGLCMALVCIPCAWTMWRAPSLRTARMLVGMSLAMAVLHAVLIMGVAAPVNHVHGVVPLTDVAAAHSSHVAPALAVIVADFVTAWLAAAWLRRAVSMQQP
ncbi:hypothetical protein [Paenarthrobacter aurescens]|uniref:hypothetical protein n=1 Tax=Paenarthrobacter aurescens TaxID=43663 RepID=UPI0021BFFBA0|nr:hypothetical protein [Paenarthrobacter aurescens]MCT9870420.1 hypothetical protein [Paenarthrobacter aurescens]